jgi:hypothetical protein
MLQLAKNNHAKFQFSSFYPNGFRHIFDHFEKKISKFSNSAKSFKWSILKDIFNQNLSRLAFFKNLKTNLIFLTPEFVLVISKFGV